MVVVVAKAYPEPDERGRGKKSAVTALFPMVAPRRLQEARAVIAYRNQDLGLFSVRENFRAGVSVYRTKAIT